MFPPYHDFSIPLLFVASLVASLDSASTESPVKGNRSPSMPWPVSPVLIGDQNIGPCSAARLPVRVHDASVGSAVLSLPDSMRVSRLSLDTHHVNHALVTNTGTKITLKQGVLGTFEIFHPSSLEESSPCPVAVFSTQLVDEDLSDVVVQISSHVKKLDYPGDKTAFVKLLARHMQAVSLP